MTILDHLWQSTLVAILICLLSLLFRNNSARVRYGLWFAASVKFLLPFSVLTAVGRMAFVHPVPASSIALLARIQPAATPFAAIPMATAPAAQHSVWLGLLLAIWLLGVFALVSFWLVRWCRLSATVHAATPLAFDVPIPVRSTSLLLEPGLVGIWRPVILLPEGLAARLSRTEIDAIIAHELCHLRRRDNLLAVVHMLVEAIFWFHPLVWFIGARLVEERENACDESVLASGSNPLDYAQAILKICRHYFRSPLACASGVSGADLDRRITAIMAKQDILDIDPGRKLLLAVLAVVTIMVPLITGGLKPAAQLAQSIVQTLLPLEQTAAEPVRKQATAPVLGVKRQHKPAPSIQPGRTVLVAPVIDAITPVIIIPIPQLESAEPQSAASDADVTVCRPPQQLRDSRLTGPRVCLPKSEWDRYKQQGLQLMPDGKTLAAYFEKARSLNPHNCPALPAGASTALGNWNVSCFYQ